MSSDVNRDRIKVTGNLVRCHAFRGKALKNTCGAVLGIIESHVDSQIFHFFNVRQVMSERLPGPLSSFRYNPKVNADVPPLVFSDKKKVLHSLLKIPVNVVTGSTSEYAIRTVHRSESGIEIGYLHIVERESVKDESPEVSSSRTTSALSGRINSPEAGPSNFGETPHDEGPHDELGFTDAQISPNRYPELGLNTYEEFVQQLSNAAHGETSEVFMRNAGTCPNNFPRVSAPENNGQVTLATNGPASGIAHVPVIVNHGNSRSTVIVSPSPKDIVVLRDEPVVPGHFHSGRLNLTMKIKFLMTNFYYFLQELSPKMWCY